MEGRGYNCSEVVVGPTKVPLLCKGGARGGFRFLKSPLNPPFTKGGS